MCETPHLLGQALVRDLSHHVHLSHLLVQQRLLQDRVEVEVREVQPLVPRAFSPALLALRRSHVALAPALPAPPARRPPLVLVVLQPLLAVSAPPAVHEVQLVLRLHHEEREAQVLQVLSRVVLVREPGREAGT